MFYQTCALGQSLHSHSLIRIFTGHILHMVNVLKFCTPYVSDKIAYGNSADPDQTALEQSDQSLHCFLFHLF